MLTRIKLAGYALLLSWLLNTAGEFVCRLAYRAGSKAPGAALFTAPVYLLTYVLFAIPFAGCCRAAWQLRFWYVPVTASLVWAVLTSGFLFQVSMKDLLGPWPSQGFPLWFAECSLSSVAIYLLLLRAAVRRTYPA